MFLERISLRNVRVYESLRFDFRSKTTVFLGSNGVGKTTILEAIHIFSSLSSFRTPRIKDLIREGVEAASAEIFCKTEVRHQLSFEVFEKTPKVLKRDGKSVRGPKFIEDLRIVSLVPEHQKLLDSAAEERRRFLDRMVFSRDPIFMDVCQRYQRALRQKRALLRKALPWTTYSDHVSAWNHELIRLAQIIREKRCDEAKEIHTAFVEEHAQIGEGEVGLKYEPSDSSLAEALAEKGRKEHLAGCVLYGPHRDDLAIFLRGRRAHRGASQGERSSLLLALKFSEMGVLSRNSTLPVLLLLDDLGATLDPNRRRKLFERIHRERVQTLITTTDKEISRAAQTHQGSVSEVCLDENPAGFSFAPRPPT